MALKMEKLVYPKPSKCMGKRMTLLLIEELLRAPKVPIERLNREARDFENNVLSSLHHAESSKYRKKK